jgi:hypothetical protein
MLGSIKQSLNNPQISTNSFGPHEIKRNQTWFIEAIKKATMDLYESAITMLESSVHNMEEAQQQLS